MYDNYTIEIETTILHEIVPSVNRFHNIYSVLTYITYL